MMKVTIYQNSKMVYTGYTKAKIEAELIKEFGEHPLPVTHQGAPLKDKDIIFVEDGNDNFRTSGWYMFVDEAVGGKIIPTLHDPASKMEPMDGVRVLMCQPGFPAVETRLTNTLKALQDAVSDHREPALIEYSFPLPDDCMILGNEEAKLINMPLNRTINGEIYAGNIYVVKDDYCGNLKDLSDGDIEKYMELIGKAETFTEDDIQKNPYLKYFGYFG